jgi:hypothetical protein
MSASVVSFHVYRIVCRALRSWRGGISATGRRPGAPSARRATACMRPCLWRRLAPSVSGTVQPNLQRRGAVAHRAQSRRDACWQARACRGIGRSPSRGPPARSRRCCGVPARPLMRSRRHRYGCRSRTSGLAHTRARRRLPVPLGWRRVSTEDGSSRAGALPGTAEGTEDNRSQFPGSGGCGSRRYPKQSTFALMCGSGSWILGSNISKLGPSPCPIWASMALSECGTKMPA